MVLAMAFASNHWAVYALAIFITATLVTELEFLERLAAIFWGRDKYFEFLKGKATASEKETAIRAEAVKELVEESQTLYPPGQGGSAAIGGGQPGPQQELDVPAPVANAAPAPAPTTNPNSDPADSLSAAQKTHANFGRWSVPPSKAEGIQDRLKELVSASKIFEEKVKNALASKLKQPAKLTFDVALRRRAGGPRMLLDAVIETQFSVYVVEIRHSSRPSAVIDTASQLARFCEAYSEFLEHRGVTKPVVALGIFPSTESTWTLPNRDMVRIDFNERTGRFEGTEQLSNGLLSQPPFTP